MPVIAARPWRPGERAEPLALASLLREASGLLGRAYTTADLAEDLTALGYPVQPSTCRGWLASGRIPAQALPAVQRARLYLTTTLHVAKYAIEEMEEGGVLLR